MYDRVSNNSVLDHARKPSEINEIVPWDNSYRRSGSKSRLIRLPYSLLLLFQNKTPILVNYFLDRLYATQLECTEVSDRALAGTLASKSRIGLIISCPTSKLNTTLFVVKEYIISVSIQYNSMHSPHPA